MILIIDNYDSFTYNIYQMVTRLGQLCEVHFNDKISLDDIEKMPIKGIILSPGPGRPENAGVTLDVIKSFAGRVPILGVCLGHQAIVQAYGGDVVCAPVVRHGKSSVVEHDNRGLFAGVSPYAKVGRYHSLVADANSLPNVLQVHALSSDDGLIMAVSHVEQDVYGVQFHPESILSEDGDVIIQNFLSVCFPA